MAEQAARAAFILRRLVVYAVLLLVVAAAIGLLDWLAAGVLGLPALALGLEAAAALALGVRLRALHALVERAIDGVLFRRRQRAAQRLRRVAAGLETALDEELLAPALIDEPVAALGLASAGLFVRVGDGAFAPDRAVAWSDSFVSLQARDAFLLHAAGSPGAFRLHAAPPLPGAPQHGDAKPRVVVPVHARDGLAAFTVYGSHTGGADLDADEIALLEHLARAAAIAFDRAEAARMRAINAELRAALAAAMAAG